MWYIMVTYPKLAMFDGKKNQKDRAYFEKWNVFKANFLLFETPIVTFRLLRRPTLALQLPFLKMQPCFYLALNNCLF